MGYGGLWGSESCPLILDSSGRQDWGLQRGAALSPALISSEIRVLRVSLRYLLILFFFGRQGMSVWGAAPRSPLSFILTSVLSLKGEEVNRTSG